MKHKKHQKAYYATLIQKTWRGYIIRKRLFALKDAFDLKAIKSMLTNFVEYTNTIVIANKKLKCKKIRNANFPSEISENIVKYAIRNHKKVCPTWDTKCGDLVIQINDMIEKRIEVKGFSSTGPSSFGPKEKWDLLYFIDCRRYKEKKFIVYEINLSNDDPRWQNIKINSTHTYKQVCKQGKRPRISFHNIIPQLKNKYVKIIFSGHINSLR